jgi:hypothetical protein
MERHKRIKMDAHMYSRIDDIYNGFIYRANYRCRSYSLRRRSWTRWPPWRERRRGLTSGNAPAADAATGVVSAASGEVSMAIGAVFSVAAVPCGKRRMKIVKFTAKPIPTGVLFGALSFKDCSLVVSRP